MDFNEIYEKLGSAETTQESFKLYSELFKVLNRKPREDIGTFLSVTPLVSKALVDLNVQDGELQQRILLILGVLVSKKIPVELPASLKEQAVNDIVNLLMVTSDTAVSTRCFWCLSQFLDAGVGLEEPMIFRILKNIEQVQVSNVKNVALYGEACALLQKMIEKKVDGLFTHIKQLAKLVFTPVFHPVSKIREITYKNLQSVAPILQDEKEIVAGPVSSVVVDLVKTTLLKDMLHLFRNKCEIYVLEVWKTVVNILGQNLHKNIIIINGLLSVVEKGFKHESQDVKLKAFDAWKTLISNFALSDDVIGIPKKLRLLLQPLLRISSTKTEAVIKAKCDTWWHIAWSLGEKVPNHFELVCLPLLEFVCGISFKDNGEIPVLPPTTVYSSSHQKIMRRKGCEILIRFLEHPLSGTFLHSPKKTPTICIPPLRKPLASVIFSKFPKEFVKAIGVVIKEFGKEPEMLSHIDYLLKLVLFAISNTPPDASKDCIDAVASFVQLVVDIVKCQLCPPILCSKLIEKLSLFPKKMLTAHYYYVGNTGVMHGNLYLTILSLLLYPMFLTMPDFKTRIVPLFQRLAGSSIKSSLSPLSYAHSIILFMKEQTVINNCDAEVLLSLWSAVSSALFGALHETLEIAESCNVEQDFSCMYDVLTYPFEYILMLNRTQGQFKAVLTKSWGDLYKLFYRCSALLPSTDNNTACEGICFQLLNCLKRDHVENSSICELLSHILPIIIECVDFTEVGKNSGKGGFSAERWARSKQNPLGNIAPLIDIIKWFLEYFHENISLESSNKDKEAHQSAVKFAVMYLEILNNFISKVTSSKTLLAVLCQLAVPLSKIFELSQKKNISTKKNVRAFQLQLEILWKTITTNIQLYYTAQYDSDFLLVLSPLLEVMLRHHKQDIKDRARQFWFASFAPNHSKLNYPPSLKEVLKKVKPPLVPGSDTSPIEDDTSFTNFNENETTFSPLPKEKALSTPSTIKQLFDVPCGMAQNKNKVNESRSPSMMPFSVKQSPFVNRSPSVKTKTPTKPKQVKPNIDDLPENEFVKITTPPSKKKLLTQHQKEARKKKSFVPALYNELSQNSSSMDTSHDLQDSCSVISVSQDECEVSIVSELRDSVDMNKKPSQTDEQNFPVSLSSAKVLKEKENVLASANDSYESEKSKETSKESHMIGALDSTKSREDHLDSIISFDPDVQMVEIEIIDVESQSESNGSNMNENVELEQTGVGKDTITSGCNSKVHETTHHASVKSVNKVSENVTVAAPDHQTECPLKTTAINGSHTSIETENQIKDLVSLDNSSSNSFTLLGEKHIQNVESSVSLSEEKNPKHLDDITYSEEIIPSSQSSSEHDFDIPKSVGLVYRVKNMKQNPIGVLSPVQNALVCNKPIPNLLSASQSHTVAVGIDSDVSGQVGRTSLVGKIVSGNKFSNALADKAKDSTVECSEAPDVISGGKENGNPTFRKLNVESEHDTYLDSDHLNDIQTVIHESLDHGCKILNEKIGSTVDGIVLNETNVNSSSTNEVCDNNIKIPKDLSSDVNPLSKEDVKKKPCVESQIPIGVDNGLSIPNNFAASEVVNSPNEALIKGGSSGSRQSEANNNSEKPVSPKKPVNKNCSSENSLKVKNSHTSIVTFVGNQSYIKTRRQVFQHSPRLTRSKLKQSNVSEVLNIENPAKKRGTRKCSVRSPKKNENIMANYSFSQSSNPLSEKSLSNICVISTKNLQKCLSAGEEPKIVDVEEGLKSMVESRPESEKLGNFCSEISKDLKPNLKGISVSSSYIDIKNDESHKHMKEKLMASELQKGSEKNSNDDKITDNLKEIAITFGDSSITSNAFVQNIPTVHVQNSNNEVCQAEKNEFIERTHSFGSNTSHEKLSSSDHSVNDNYENTAEKSTAFVVQMNLVSCNVPAKEDNCVDQVSSILEVPHSCPEISEMIDNSSKHNYASNGESVNLVSDKVIFPDSDKNNGVKLSVEKQGLLPAGKNDQNKMKCVLDKNLALCGNILVNENATIANETVLQSLILEKSEINSVVSHLGYVENSEAPVSTSSSCVINCKDPVEKEIDLESDKKNLISKDTNNLLESTTSNNIHGEQHVQCCDIVKVVTVNHSVDLPCVPSARREVAECSDNVLQVDKSPINQKKDNVMQGAQVPSMQPAAVGHFDSELQINKNPMNQEKDTAECQPRVPSAKPEAVKCLDIELQVDKKLVNQKEDTVKHQPHVPHVKPEVESLDIELLIDKSPLNQEASTAMHQESTSDANFTAENQQNSPSSSHNVTGINFTPQKSDISREEYVIQFDKNLLNAGKKSPQDKEILLHCSKVNSSEMKIGLCELPTFDTLLQNSLNKEKLAKDDSVHKSLILEEPEPNSDEAIKNDGTNNNQEDLLQDSMKLHNISGSDSPAKTKNLNNKLIHAAPVSSIFCGNKIKDDVSYVSPSLKGSNCDTGLSLSPCSGAKKRKQKTPSNSCLVMDIKRKKLELRRKKEDTEKISSPKQTHNENVDLECIVTQTKQSRTKDDLLSTKASVPNEKNEGSTRAIPEKFMQLWHADVVIDNDANVVIQEKKQKLPPEKIKSASPSNKSNIVVANDQTGFETDKPVADEFTKEENSSTSVLRDVRNSPLQWRSTSSSSISILMSPLSRSQRMLRAARKHMNSPDTVKQNVHPKSSRTASLESPSTSKNSLHPSENSKVCSPVVYSSILKKRTSENLSSPTPPHKKRKVSFAEPLVQGEMIFEPYDNENSSRARRSAKRCLQMNRDHSQRNRRKYIWLNQEQERYLSLKKSQSLSNVENAEASQRNSGMVSETDSEKKLEESVPKKSEEKIDEVKLEGRVEGSSTEQNNVILDRVDEPTCPPPVAFSTSHLSPTSSPMASDIPSSDTYENSEEFEYDSQVIVFEELVSCNDPVGSIIPLLTSPMWVRGLSQLLLSRNISTIGHLSGLTADKLKALPIKSPKLETVQNILREYALQWKKPEICIPDAASPSSSSPSNCDISGGKADVPQYSEGYQNNVVKSDQSAVPLESGETSGTTCENDSLTMQVEPCRELESTCTGDSSGRLGDEHDKRKCHEWIHNLCNSEVIQEMPLILLCDLITKITNGIKAKTHQKLQDET